MRRMWLFALALGNMLNLFPHTDFRMFEDYDTFVDTKLEKGDAEWLAADWGHLGDDFKTAWKKFAHGKA